MALSGPDNWGAFRKRKPWGGLMGSYLGDRNRSPQPNARFRQDPFPSMASDPTWSVASTYPAKTPHTPMAGKKGLGINDWMDAFSELKTFTPKFGSASAPRGVGSNPLAKFSPMPGLNPNYDWSYGGLDFDPLKRQKKMMGSLV